MQLTWNGHSNFLLQQDGVSFRIDPFFEGNPCAPTDCDLSEKVDAVLVTHDHGDHVGQSIEICKETGAPLVGVFDTVNKLIEQGLPQGQGIGMNIGGSVELAGVQIQMVQAMHSTASGVAAGYILTFPNGFCIYHAGDTGIFSSMQLFSFFHNIQVALLPIGGHFTMGPRQAAFACKMLGCRKVVPMHWGTFPILEQNTDNFARQLKDAAPDTELISMTPGSTVTLNK
jgi:L-ascorbate metabolism protein UlaG (beta-lactamase superfamily)